ncbi:MAG: hypothetical protein L3J67_13965 [Hyphomicrobiaceae bacterium]|nr:hypothetical protein [Hyphomicrobiaceae bacterium]
MLGGVEASGCSSLICLSGIAPGNIELSGQQAACSHGIETSAVFCLNILFILKTLENPKKVGVKPLSAQRGTPVSSQIACSRWL